LRISELPSISKGSWLNFHQDCEVRQIFIDSRKHFSAQDSLFIAFRGGGHDGHDFIEELYQRGVRHFVVEREVKGLLLPEANIWLVQSCLHCLQDLAIYKRNLFKHPVIAITGSNGKTIIKEWLFQVLSPEHSIIKSPGSYNSQIGVPLSVLPAEPWHTLGIFEAGISKIGEMEHLEKILQPEIGLFTNLLSAHDEGFKSREEKAIEKAKLFKQCKQVVYRSDDPILSKILKSLSGFTWRFEDSEINDSRIDDQVIFEKVAGGLVAKYFGKELKIQTTFLDQASIENLCHVVTMMILLGYNEQVIADRCQQLRRLPMRLEMKDAVNGCKIIDDSYSNDLSSLKIALDFLKAQHSGKKAIILSDLQQTGMTEEGWFGEVKKILGTCDLEEVIGIGPVLGSQASLLHPQASGFPDVESFIHSIELLKWQNLGILIKGARSFKLEQIVEKLQRHIHGTVMEIDLLALNRNLNSFRHKLKSGTRLMVMVKAFAYGSGASEIARFLEHNGVHYLGVAYADEGVALRNKGIRIPIMVMNPAPESCGLLVTHDLEPAIFSPNQLNDLIARLRGERLGIHIKLDTGMHRLGFEPEHLADLCTILRENINLQVRSIYSHLAASESPEFDEFTHEQSRRFVTASEVISKTIGYTPFRHLLNTNGIIRFPEYHFDMVRLGIGLYGVGASQQKLEEVVTLKTVISQIKTILPGETVGYGRSGQVNPGTKIATIAIGYADGYNRGFGRGKGKVLINGQLAPTVGNICMDMTMVDITNISAQEGDEVIVYGKDLSPAEVSSWINTIPYELLTATGDRVRRVFHSAG